MDRTLRATVQDSLQYEAHHEGDNKEGKNGQADFDINRQHDSWAPM